MSIVFTVLVYTQGKMYFSGRYELTKRRMAFKVLEDGLDERAPLIRSTDSTSDNDEHGNARPPLSSPSSPKVLDDSLTSTDDSPSPVISVSSAGASHNSLRPTPRPLDYGSTGRSATSVDPAVDYVSFNEI